MNLDTTGHQFSFSLTGTITNTLNNGKTASAAHSGEMMPDLITHGVEAGEISRAFEENDIVILDGASVEIDFAAMAARNVGAGLGKDKVGQDIVFEEIVTIVVKVTEGPGRLTINEPLPAADVWSAIPLNAARAAVGGSVGVDGVRVWHEPGSVGLPVDPTDRKVRFGASGGDLKFDLLVMGRHDSDASSSSSHSSSSQSSSSTSTSSTSLTSTSSS